MNEFFSCIFASCTQRIAHWREYSSLHSIHLEQGSLKEAYSFDARLKDHVMVLPSSLKPTVRG